jgi:hypothetical protein
MDFETGKGSTGWETGNEVPAKRGPPAHRWSSEHVRRLVTHKPSGCLPHPSCSHGEIKSPVRQTPCAREEQLREHKTTCCPGHTGWCVNGARQMSHGHLRQGNANMLVLSHECVGIPCWCNHLAKEGRYNLDPDIKFFATPPVHGSLAEVSRYHQHGLSCMGSRRGASANPRTGARDSQLWQCMWRLRKATAQGTLLLPLLPSTAPRSSPLASHPKHAAATYLASVTHCGRRRKCQITAHAVRGPPRGLLLPAAGQRESRGGRHVRAAQRRRARMPPRGCGAWEAGRSAGSRPHRCAASL